MHPDAESSSLLAPDAETSPAGGLIDAPPLPPRRRRALRVAGIVLGLAGATVAATWLAPLVLPTRIVEGPLVQQTTETGALLVWYTSRSSRCGLELPGDPAGAECSVGGEGSRHVATIGGLSPGGSYEYRIREGRRLLFDGRLQTNRPRGQPFRFFVFGDSGRGTGEQYRLAEQMTRQRPDFILHTGDLVYPDGARRKYEERFFRPYAELLSSVTFWPSLGNHDVSKPALGGPYLEVFELPTNGPPAVAAERCYWFDYGEARLVVIDSNLDEETLAGAVAPWLRRVFEESAARWRIVCFHHPPYTAGSHDPDVRVQRALVPAFDAARVHLVFSGHDHLYERMRPLRAGRIVGQDEGTLYIVSGCGGAKLYDVLPPDKRPGYLATFNNSVHSYTEVSVGSERIHGRQIAIDGAVLDEWSLSADGAAGAPSSVP
jgi:hypothetical protein